MMRPPREAARRLARGARQHALAHLLCDKKSAFDVGIEDVIKVFGRDLLQALRGGHARVVDQDVDGAHLGFGVRHGGLDGVVVGHVQLHHMGVAALAFNLRAQRLELFQAAAGQHHTRTGLGQGARKLRPQTAGGAGHQGHAARQVDAVCHRGLPLDADE